MGSMPSWSGTLSARETHPGVGWLNASNVLGFVMRLTERRRISASVKKAKEQPLTLDERRRDAMIDRQFQ